MIIRDLEDVKTVEWGNGLSRRFLLEADAMKAMGKWHYVVLDEGHKIKNSRSNISQALLNIPCVSRMLLTGTPLQNNLTELWSLLHWLYPHIYTAETEQKFTHAFDLGQGRVDSNFMQSSQSLLRLIMMRRTKEGVAGELSVPPRHEHTLYVPLSPLQRFWYERLLTKTDKAVFSVLFDRDQSASASSSRGPGTPIHDKENSRSLTKKATAQVRSQESAEGADKGKNSAWQVRRSFERA